MNKHELKAEITFIPEKERKIRTFYQEYAKSLFEKETAMKYDYLIYWDGIYEEGKQSKTDRKTLIDLIAAESEGVTDYMNEEQCSVIVPLVHKYEELSSSFVSAEKPAANSGRVYAKRFYTYGNESFFEKIPEKAKRRRAL